MNAYSLDFRKAVLMYVDEGHTQREAAALFSTLAEAANHFNCGINAVFKALRKLGYTYKKNKKSIRKETNQRGLYLLKE